jgi:hypothetical protein
MNIRVFYGHPKKFSELTHLTLSRRIFLLLLSKFFMSEK